MAQRALSHSWVSPIPGIAAHDILTQGANCTQFSPENSQLCYNGDFQQQQHQQPCTANFSAQDISPYRPISPFSSGEIPNGFMCSPQEVSGQTKSTVDSGSMLLSPAMIGNLSNGSESVEEFSGFSISLPHDNMQGNMETTEEDLGGLKKNQGAVQVNNQWSAIRSIGFPFSLPPNDTWKPNLLWDLDSPPCPSEISTSFSTNKCYN